MFCFSCLNSNRKSERHEIKTAQLSALNTCRAFAYKNSCIYFSLLLNYVHVVNLYDAEDSLQVHISKEHQISKKSDQHHGGDKKLVNDTKENIL
jgi:hypothetical protein